MVKIISMRSIIVYTNFIVIPIIVCLLWLLLPINTYTKFSVTSMIYFVFMFFTWISFYDLNLPGCSKIQIGLFYLVFIGIAIGWLNVVTKLNVEDNRMSYSFIDAITWLLSSCCYLIHIVVHKIKKQYYYQDDTVMDGFGVKRRKRRSKPWTKRLSKIFCYYKRIDMDEADQRKQMFEQHIEEHPHVFKENAPANTTNVVYLKDSAERIHSKKNSNNGGSNPPSLTNSINYSEGSSNSKTDSNNNNNNNNNNNVENENEEAGGADITVKIDSVAQAGDNDGLGSKIEHALGTDDTEIEMTTQSKDKKTKTTIQYFKKTGPKEDGSIGGDVSSRATNTKNIRMSPSMMFDLMPKHELSYRNFFSVCLYQLFVIITWFWLHNFTTLIIDKNLFKTPFLALVAIVVFHISRLLLSGISNALNRFLKPKEIRYFTFFQFPTMFFLYYRNLFLNINDWSITVLVSIVLFAIDLIYYLLHMTKRYWFFRHQGLIDFFDRRPDSKWCRLLRNTLEDQNPSYDQHVRDLSVEYYYDKMAEYVSIVTMVMFLSLIRALDYKNKYYPRFYNLSEDDYLQLMWRYLYLLCFEVTYDLLIRFLTRRLLKIDISNRGRNETISNFTTRFIFSLFLIYNLLDIYSTQIIYKEDFTPTVPVNNSTVNPINF